MNDITNVITATATDAVLGEAPPPAMKPENFVAAVFKPFKTKFAAAKRAADKAPAYDITTSAGMAVAKELRASFRDIRTSLENERKARKAPIIEAGKLLDARAAELKAEIEPLEDRYDREIKAEEGRKAEEKARKEAEERARVEAIEGRIASIRAVPGRMASADSVAIAKEIDQWTLLRLDPAEYDEYLEDALRAVNTTIDQLGDLRAAAEAREAEQRRIAAEREELARLRAEQEERERLQREADAERERVAAAERRAAAERQALADAAAEEQRRQIEAMKAEQERNMRIMQDIQAIQARTTLDVSLRALVPALDETRAIVVDEKRFGSMASMAQTAKDMAVSALEAKFNAALADAHAEALADDAAYVPPAPVPVTLRVMIDNDPEEAAPGYVQQDEPITERPEDGEILDVLAQHYSVEPATVIGWLLDLAKRLEA